MIEPTDNREKILHEAKRLFVEYGYHGLSMRQVAEAVPISKAGIYHYFRDKEDLFLAVLSTYLDELETILRQAQAETRGCRACVTFIIERILAQPPEQRAVIRLAHQELSHLALVSEACRSFGVVYHQKVLGQLEAMFHTGIERGELRAMDTSVASWTLLGMLYPYLSSPHAPMPGVSTHLASQLLTIYFDGLTLRESSSMPPDH